MNLVCRTIGVLVIAGAGVVGVNGQDTTTSKPTTQSTTTQTTTQDYVFPTADERFKRYVKDTVGPIRLLRTGAAAGIQQWRDSPEEWEQGMKGYSKRFASGMGRNAIQQTV